MARRSSTPRPPFGVLTYYGPDTRRATKLVASVFTRTSGTAPADLERWTIAAGDIRNDDVVADHVAAWLLGHGVKETLTEERILGCPHEEGIDYPMGRACPRCPFWADVDRFTHERLTPPVAAMSVAEVLAAISQEHATSPVEALESADAHRDALTQPLLDAVERGLARGVDASDEEAQLLSYALYLLAKWREPRACPLVLQWLSLPGDVSDALTGDILTQDGARILAGVYDGNLPAIRELILNRAADEYSRAVAIGGLALLAAWLEVPRTIIVDEFLVLAREGLERQSGYVWAALVNRCIDIEAVEVFPELRRAYEEGLVDSRHVHVSEVDAEEQAPRGLMLAATREREAPIMDVADASAWWRSFGDETTGDGGTERLIADGSEPYRAPPKVGRNEPCPCGSGRKYKKCCGAPV